MFMLSFRLTGKKVMAGLLAVVLVCAVGYTGVRMITGRSVETSTVQAQEIKVKDVKVKNEEQRLAFVRGFGWEVEEEPAEILEVIIPKEFDETYQQYNAIQKKQGCDLEKYAGKRVKRYSWVITNYPGVDSEVRINVLVYKDKVIGGDVCSLDAEGFMHGFVME